MLLRNFAIVNDVPTGTEYVTSSMDFQKAEIALKNLVLSYVVSAAFSPQVMLVKFPNGFTREFIDSSTLPSLSHTIVDPVKVAVSGLAPAVGDLKITTSPSNARVYIDNEQAGTATPGAIFSGIRLGAHEIRVEMDGFVPEVKTVNVTAGQITSLTAILSYVMQTPVQTIDLNLTESQTTPSQIILCFGVMMACLALIGSALLYRRKR